MWLVIRTDAGNKKLVVSDYEEASREVRDFIKKHDLGSGCSRTGKAFRLATIAKNPPDGEFVPLATVTYNGRVWSCDDGAEIKMGA